MQLNKKNDRLWKTTSETAIHKKPNTSTPKSIIKLIFIP